MSALDVDWPDATVEVARWLTAGQPLPVHWTVPNPRPNVFLLVRRAGSGPPLSWADWASMDIECWSGEPHSNPKPAHVLAAGVKRLLRRMPLGPNPVADLRIDRQVFFPDPTTSVPRVVLGAGVLVRPV